MQSREEWTLLLRLVLAQRLEMNAMQSALKDAKVLTDSQIREIRVQAAATAAAWSRDDKRDLLALIGMHSSPEATMSVPLGQEAIERLRREIDDQTPQR
jgi:hypothetical protein